MARYLFTSDWHGDLGKCKAVVEHCNSHGIDALFFGGDLVDGMVKPEGQEKAVSQHSHFIHESLEEVLSAEEKEMQQRAQNEEQLQHLLMRAMYKHRAAVSKGYQRRVEEKELSVMKGLLAGYRGRKIFAEGNHDPKFVKEYMKDAVEYVGEGILDVGGVKIAGGCASYEPCAAALQFPELFPHTQGYHSTNDEKIAREDFSQAQGTPAQIYLWHKGITDRFSPDKADSGNTHDYQARKLVEVARAKGEDPLVLSGHFHSLDAGRNKGILQFRAAPEYAFELVYDEGRKKLTEIIVYEFVDAQQARMAA